MTRDSKTMGDDEPTRRHRIAGLPPGVVTGLGSAAGARLSQSPTLSHAAQTFLGLIYEAFPSVMPLLRTYVMVPAAALGSRHQGYLAARGQAGTITPETPVLALIGTRGDGRAWNDIRHSQGHLCIPLTSPAAVQGVPMVAALLTELGLDLEWLRVPRDVFARKLLGGFNGVFYVAAATRAADHMGRLIIPAQDFVAAQGIVTVFGIGGAYLDGTIMASIFFTREALTREEAERFAPLASVFKSQTSHLVAAGRIFDE